MAMTEADTTPIPAHGSFYITGGTLPYHAASYVPRRADHDLLAGLNGGEFCYVLNTRQMGKSSLMIRTAHQLRQQGNTVAVLDLTAIGQNLSPDQWYDGLLMSLAEQLSLEDALEDFWQDNTYLGPLQRFMTALGKIVLPQIAQRLVIFVDEIDAVRSLPFPADEFFAAIRECYNRRQTDPIYEKLAFCLLGVATPADLIVDTRMSPFNIGRRILLTDFVPSEAVPLAQGLVGGQPVLDRALYWTNGHPYMTQRLCRAIAEEPEIITPAQVDALCGRLFLTKQARETDDNLAFVRNRLLRSEVDLAALLDLYTQVRAGKKVKDDDTNPLVPVLRLSGVVAANEGFLQQRNRVYDGVFDKEWVQAHMPHAEVRRQQAAFRRGALRTAALAAVILLLMGMLSAWALSENHAAQASARTAKQALKETQDALTAEQIAEQQAQIQEKRADQKANEASAAKLVAETAAGSEKAASNLAHARLLETERQKKVANDQTEAALEAQAQAEREKTAAQDAQKEALAQKSNAVAAKKNTQNLLQVANLQLAQQTWDSSAGTAAAVRDQLAMCRATPRSDSRERFEWRYQWALLHGASMRSFRPGGCQTSITPDGFLVALDTANRLHRMQIADGSHVGEVNLGNLGPVVYATLSPDGAQVALGRQDGDIEVRDTRTWKKTVSWPSSGHPVTALSFRQNGQEVQGVSAEDGVRVWDIPTGQLLHHWSEDQYQASGGHWVGSWFSYDAWSEDDKYRAVAHDDQRIIVSDMERLGKPGYTPQILEMPAEITSLAFSPDGRRLAAGDETGGVMLWNMAEGGTIKTSLPRLTDGASGADNPADALAFSPDGTRLAEGRENGLIQIVPLDSPSAAPVSLKGHASAIAALRFSADGRRLASSDTAGTARAWDTTALSSAPPRLASGAGLVSVAFAPSGAQLAGVGSDGSAALWNSATWQARPLPATETKTLVASAAFAPNGHLAAWGGRIVRAGGARLCVQFWNPLTQQPAQRWESPAIGKDFSGLRALAFSPDSRLLAGDVAQDTKSGAVQLWNADTGQSIHSQIALGSPINALCFAGGFLYAACHDGTVHCLETRHWTEVRDLLLGREALCLAASPDGRRLAIGDASGRIMISPAQGGSARVLTELTGRVGSVAFSPDGWTLVSTGSDRRVSLWDVATGRRTRALTAEEDGDACVAFAPNGSVLVSGRDNGRLQFWPAASPARIRAWAEEEREAAPQTTSWTTPAQQRAEYARLVQEIQTGQIRPTEISHPVFAANRSIAPALSISEGAVAAEQLENGAYRLDVRSSGPHLWDVQVTQDHLNLENGKGYLVQFLARAEPPMLTGLQFQRDLPNHDDAGLNKTLAVPTDWRPYRFVFQATRATPYHTHLIFEPRRGTLWLKNLLLTELAADGSPAAKTDIVPEISRTAPKAFALLPEVRRHQISPVSRPIPGPGLLEQKPGWEIWMDGSGEPRANWSVTSGDALDLNVTRVDGTDWHIQIVRKAMALKPGQAYILQFRARADKAEYIRMNTQLTEAPYTHNGLEASLALTQQWRAYRFPFVLQNILGHSCLSICVGQAVNHLYFADAVLTPDPGYTNNYSRKETSQ